MNIISGHLKGMTVKTIHGQEHTRPTQAKIREAVMNMLMPELEEGAFWDVFAGSGSIGLEALSRGSQSCIFWENRKDCIAMLKTNIKEAIRRFEKQKLTIPEIVIIQDDIAMLERGKHTHLPKAHILWMDPPYETTVEWVKKLEREIAKRNPGFFVVEAAFKVRDELVTNLSASWNFCKEKRFGDTVVLVLEKKAEKIPEETEEKPKTEVI